jgi:hypothetical protein
MVYCQDQKLGCIYMHSINSVGRQNLFGVIYRWCKETIFAVFDTTKSEYKFLTSELHVSKFFGLKTHIALLRQIIACYAMLKYYSITKSKYPYFKIKLKDIQHLESGSSSGNAEVSFLFLYQKQRADSYFKITLKGDINNYGDA